MDLRPSPSGLHLCLLPTFPCISCRPEVSARKRWSPFFPSQALLPGFLGPPSPLSPLAPSVVTACARSPGGSLISRLTALLRFGLLVSQTPVPKRRGIFLNTALICVFLHSKPVMVPCGTCAPMTAGACLSIPTAPHHTASQGTCHSLSRWPHAPEPSSVLLFLSLHVGPPHTLFPRPSPPVDPTCSSGPSSGHREPAVTQSLTLTSPFSKCLLKSITSLYVALYSPLFLVCSC